MARAVRVARGQLLSPGLPGVAQGDDMVDIDGGPAADVVEMLPGVGVDLGPGRNSTGTQLRHVCELSGENVLAGIAAVAVDIFSCGAEAFPGVSGKRSASFHGQHREHGQRCACPRWRRGY